MTRPCCRLQMQQRHRRHLLTGRSPALWLRLWYRVFLTSALGSLLVVRYVVLRWQAVAHHLAFYRAAKKRLNFRRGAVGALRPPPPDRPGEYPYTPPADLLCGNPHPHTNAGGAAGAARATTHADHTRHPPSPSRTSASATRASGSCAQPSSRVVLSHRSTFAGATRKRVAPRRYASCS